MKNLSGLLLFSVLLCVCVVAFVGCFKDTTTRTYTLTRPILKTTSAVLADINGQASEPIGTAGKIYIKGRYIYLNEVDKGIHVIDNGDPSHPVQTAFLRIPGNRDMAVKDNILYADMYASLLALDLSDLHKVSVSKIVYNFFTSRRAVNGYFLDSNMVATGWITKDTTVEENNQPGIMYSNCANCAVSVMADTKAPTATGTAGSMAAMVLTNNYLYAITESHSVGIINVNNSASPVKAGNVYAGFDLQTIYPFQDKLFLGSSIGMYMYNISDPVHPVSLGQFSHGRACDPVVTDGNFAYVTLHAGTSCGGVSNELNIINVQDIMKPLLVKTYALTKPTGLCKDGDLLFICDGSDGVKVFNAADPSNLKQLQQIKSANPYDVIAANKHAMVVAQDGLYQYDYTDVDNIRQLSVFSLRN